MKTKSSSIAVISPPRLAGERKPSTAKHIVMIDIASVCTPVPTKTESSIGSAGGRKTSPWTSFQPVSSSISSDASIALYLRCEGVAGVGRIAPNCAAELRSPTNCAASRRTG